MAFETSTLVNGEWTRRTLDVNAVLRHYNEQDRQAASTVLEVEKAPILGLLTQTVISSPLVHWILPVKLRDLQTHDVAFIGDDFVQIKELRPDGLLRDVIRKDILGARIRNARIVGSVKAYERDLETNPNGPQVKDEDSDTYMGPIDCQNTNYVAGHLLPPQAILLQLSTGDSVFLMLRRSESGNLEFSLSRRRVAKPMLHLQPGVHLAVDPSSRYMAVGCSEGVFAIYALYSRYELKNQYSKRPQPRHIESETHIYFNGIIHKMEFLYPCADDEDHIILLVLTVVKGKTRMLLYEWETGSNLKRIRPNSIKGHLLHKSRQCPLLLIPLTIKSAFILVCEDSMTVCQGILQGSPTFIDFHNGRVDSPTSLHHGLGVPLWTAWARPARYSEHVETKDDIYIAREDGLIKFLEIDSEAEEFVTSEHSVGEFEANCGTALASLAYDFEQGGDLLVMGGDSCAGGTYLVAARNGPVFKEPVQNWSPALDFVTTSVSSDRDTLGSNQSDKEAFPKPDRLFAITGKGVNGAVTEFRYGFEANIGLEMEYDTPIMKAWMFPPGSFDRAGEQSFNSTILLSLGDRSSVLRMSGDATQVEEIDSELTDFDVHARTIAASVENACGIQVTEKSIRLRIGPQLYAIGVLQLLAIHQEGSLLSFGQTMSDAVIGEGVVLFTTYHESSNYVGALLLDAPSEPGDNGEVVVQLPGARLYALGEFSSEVTSLSISRIDDVLCAIIAERTEGSNRLIVKPVIGGTHQCLNIPATWGNEAAILDAIVSLVVAQSHSKDLSLLCGTRTGTLVGIDIDKRTFTVGDIRVDRIGATSVIVTKDKSSMDSDIFFANCDSKIYALTLKSSLLGGAARTSFLKDLRIHQVWLTDALNPGKGQPKINCIARAQQDILGESSSDVLLVAESQLYIARLSSGARAVPRHILIGGSPNRLLYSQTLEVLIVGTVINGKSTLQFIDPNLGTDISQPVDQKTKSPTEYASGLGNYNEKVFRLFEWSYVKDGKTWNFLIVSTSTGRLLIISIKDADRIREHVRQANFYPGISRPDINYFTKYKFKCSEPVYSVTGFTDGLLWCSGDKLYCDTLDLAEKRFKRVAEYELPSPATNLIYDNGTIYALTSRHSLEVLQLIRNISEDWDIIRTHGDKLARATLHHTLTEQTPQNPVHLVSDKMGSIAGLWATHNTKADVLETIFEAQLPYSTLRFRFGRCRPIWDPVWSQALKPSFALNESTVTRPHFQSSRDRPEMLGLSITGVLSHYTILNFNTWNFLRFLIDLAIRSPKVCEFTYKDDALQFSTARDPKIMMHIDGDILKRCLNDRLLEELLRIGQQTEEAQEILRRFSDLLQEIHGGTLEEDGRPESYVEQAYSDLELYLRPVM